MTDATRSFRPPPPGVTATLAQDGERVTIDAPPLGLWRGSFGLIIFGPALVLVAVVAITRIVMSEGGIAPVMLAWFVGLGLVGVGMTLAAQLMGLRATRIEADGEALTLTTRSVFGARRFATTRADVERVAVGEAPFTARNKPIVRLEVVTRSAGRKTLLTARPPEEVAWAAQTIAAALGMPKSKGPAGDAADRR